MKLAIAALALLMTAAATEAASLSAMAPDAIAEIVDVRSFRSSIGPRLQDNLPTFRDYDFTDIAVIGGTAELRDPDGTWMFGITVVVAGDDRVVLCILDRALGGPTYDAQKPEAFELGPEGLLVATGEKLTVPTCPVRGE